MPESLVDMVLRLARDGKLETLVSDSLATGQETQPIRHGRPHLVRFSSPATLLVQEFEELPDGSLRPKGAPRTEQVGPDNPAIRPAGIWSVKVISGQANFEKDFVRPDDMPTGPRPDEE